MESRGAWRYIRSVVRGTSHVALDKPCQDFAYVRVHTDCHERPVLVAIAADGAGSAERSDDGARTLCDLLANQVDEHLRTEGASIDQISAEFLSFFLTYFQSEIMLLAAADGSDLRDFACTLLLAVVGENQAVVAQLGDGAIVFSLRGEPNSYQLAFSPAHGEYANMTQFATDPDAVTHLQVEVLPDQLAEVALFTDGLERLALNLQTMQPHLPFFRPMFAPVRQADGEGAIPGLTDALGAFLDSKAVNGRTDDDKTLILASRC